MRLIIAGSRSINAPRFVADAADRFLAEGLAITCVISGTAPGVERLGEAWAVERGIEVRRFPALWDRYGLAAGAMRNEEMAANADGLIAIWDGRSKGTADMIRRARVRGLVVRVHGPQQQLSLGDLG